MTEYTVGFYVEIGGYVDIEAESPEKARSKVALLLDSDEQEVLKKSDVTHREVNVTDVL